MEVRKLAKECDEEEDKVSQDGRGIRRIDHRQYQQHRGYYHELLLARGPLSAIINLFPECVFVVSPLVRSIVELEGNPLPPVHGEEGDD